MKRVLEVAILLILVLLALSSLCWGPPLPPSSPPNVPAGSPLLLVVTAGLIAGYGWWKTK